MSLGGGREVQREGKGEAAAAAAVQAAAAPRLGCDLTNRSGLLQVLRWVGLGPQEGYRRDVEAALVVLGREEDYDDDN